MMCILQALAILALIAAGILVMLGVLTPSEIFKRVGTVLVLLLVVPTCITYITRCVIIPSLVAVGATIPSALHLLPVAAVLALVSWGMIRYVQRHFGKDGYKAD